MSRADAQRRATTAARMRVEGSTWDEIADAIGVNNAQAAHRAVQRFYMTMPQLDAADARREIWERCQWLWSMAARDIEEGKPGAITAGVRVLERFSKLSGIDAPARLEIGHVESFFAALYEPIEADSTVTMPELPSMPALPAGD